MSLARVMISGGGTGGHVFPAIAIADALRAAVPNIKIHFVGAEGKMEMTKVPEAGYEITGLWISGFQRKLTAKNLLFPFKLIYSLLQARKLISKFKPQVVVGVGGYASGPLLKIASQKNIPTVLQEQNSYPGITNRLLSKHASKICVAYDGMNRFFPEEKIVFTGNPTRAEVTQIEGKREKALAHFGLTSTKKTVLAIGGSLGAKTINESIKSTLGFWQENNIQLIWQTGKYYEEDIKAFATDKNLDGVYYSTFIKEMDLAYAAADVIVSRAGAISVSELCLVGKPVILIPSPNVAEDHQTKNAKSLVEKNAAVLIKDADAIDTLGKMVYAVLTDEEKQAALAKNIKTMARENAAKDIANEIMKLATA